MGRGAEGTPRWLEEVREYWKELGGELCHGARSEESGLQPQKRIPDKRREAREAGPAVTPSEESE